MTHEFYVDSRELFDTITTPHVPRGYRLRKTLVRIKDAFESNKLNGVKWINGRTKMVDALTKWNWEMAEKLNIMLVIGI